MTYETLVDPATVEAHLDDPAWAVVDCRFSLAEPARGRRDYLEAHVPGAVYAHLDDDLSGPVVPGRTGRHPLPAVDALAGRLGRMGIEAATQVVIYDDMKGGIAARLWWLLGWLGHDARAVVDGGWPRWVAEDRPTRAGEETRAATAFVPAPRPEWIAEVDQVAAAGASPDVTLIDARAAERYLGEQEPIDEVAGHIPGAISLPWPGNLDDRGRFLPVDALRRRFVDRLGGASADRVICYCGSGVTACHDVLAAVHAGLPQPRLYPGSWSEWITDASRPVAKGE
jgi:thiosulfate/3-mercaptopyruvate sulfurtransferase